MKQTDQRVPILVIAFNRPKTLTRQLHRIEQLKSRKIQISIDGPRNSEDLKVIQEVRFAAEKWAIDSKHEISIFSSNLNLGLHGHFQVAFSKFFGDHLYGLVLEDDIDFNMELVKFIDSNIGHNRYLMDAWSIMGHNPFQVEGTAGSPQVQFFESKVHTIWGWASSSVNVEKFLSFYNADSRERRSAKAINEVAAHLTNDIFLRNAINATWRRKISRAVQGGGGWDNWWVIAGWESGLNSLMPNQSLSREELGQTEGQSHQHLTIDPSWSANLKVDVASNFQQLDRKYDRRALKMWGIGRRYSWAYAYRISKELKSFEEQGQL
jgi:hypothetical protein